MISQKRVIEVARSIVDIRIALVVHGNAAMIDNNLMGGVELAHAVASGYISQLTLSGERRLMETRNRIAALRETLQSKPALPAGMGSVSCTTPHGTTYYLINDETGRPVRIGETVTADHTEGDEPYATFVVTGATWRDDINESSPCLVGRWSSYESAETYPMSSNGFQVHWES